MYRRISQMTFQPKSVGKMWDFETLTPLYLPKFKSNAYLYTITQKMADQGRSEFLCSFNHNPLRHQLSYFVRYEAEIHKLSLTGFSEPVC